MALPYYGQDQDYASDIDAGGGTTDYGITLPGNLATMSPLEKAGLYNQFIQQGFTDPQIRGAVTSQYGAQTDQDWSALTGLAQQQYAPPPAPSTAGALTQGFDQVQTQTQDPLARFQNSDPLSFYNMIRYASEQQMPDLSFAGLSGLTPQQVSRLGVERGILTQQQADQALSGVSYANIEDLTRAASGQAGALTLADQALPPTIQQPAQGAVSDVVQTALQTATQPPTGSPEWFRNYIYQGGADDTVATQRGLDYVLQQGMRPQEAVNLWNQALGTQFSVNDFFRIAPYPAPTKTTVFGDSISSVVGYTPTGDADTTQGKSLEDILSNYTGGVVNNVATGGQTSQDALSGNTGYGSFEQYLSSNRPDQVILRYGAADAIKIGDAAKSLSNIEQMINIAQRYGSNPVLVGVSPFFGGADSIGGNIAGYLTRESATVADQINAGIEQLAQKYGLQFVNVRDVPIPAGSLLDGVHQDVRLGRAMADKIGQSLATPQERRTTGQVTDAQARAGEAAPPAAPAAAPPAAGALEQAVAPKTPKEALDLALKNPTQVQELGQFTVVPISEGSRLSGAGLDLPPEAFNWTPEAYEVTGLTGKTDKGVDYEGILNYSPTGDLNGYQVKYKTGGDSGYIVNYDAAGNPVGQPIQYDDSEGWRRPAGLALSFLGATLGAPYIGQLLGASAAYAPAVGGAVLGGAGAAVSGAEGADILKQAAISGLSAGAGQLTRDVTGAIQGAIPGVAGDIATGAARGVISALPTAIATGDARNLGVAALTGGVSGVATDLLADMGFSPQQVQGAVTIANQLLSDNPNVNSIINAAGQLANSPNASIAAKAAVMLNQVRSGASPFTLIGAAQDLYRTIEAAQNYETDRLRAEGDRAARAFPPAGPMTPEQLEATVAQNVRADQTLKIGAGQADDITQAAALARGQGYSLFEFPSGSGKVFSTVDTGAELEAANRQFIEQERISKLPDYSASDTLSSAAMKAYTEGNTGTFMYKGSEYQVPDAIDIATGKATALPVLQMGIPTITGGTKAAEPPAVAGTYTAPPIPIPSVTVDYGGVPIDYSAVSPETGAATTETVVAPEVAEQGPIRGDQTVEVTGRRLNEYERWLDYLDKYFPGGEARKDSLGNTLTPPTFEDWQAMGGRTQPAEVAQIGSDVLKSAVSGAAEVAKAPFVLANLIAGKSGSPMTEGLASYINSVEQSMSPEFKSNQALMNKVLGADPSVWETLKAYAVNPQQALNFLARTSPTILAGGAAGLGARLMGAGASAVEAAAILTNAGVHGAQSADSAMEQARQLGYSDEQGLKIGRTTAALASLISAGAQKIVPGAMSIEAKIAGTSVPALIGRETGEAMLDTGKSALRSALTRYGGEIVSEDIEEGSAKIITNLAVGRPWDEGLSRTLVEATIASGGLTAAVDAISSLPTVDRLLTQAQADPEGKQFSDLVFLGRTPATTTAFEAGPAAIGFEAERVFEPSPTPALTAPVQQIGYQPAAEQVATGTALDEQIAREQRVSDIVGDITQPTQAPTTLPQGATPDMVAFFDEKGTPVTYRELGLTAAPQVQPSVADPTLQTQVKEKPATESLFGFGQPTEANIVPVTQEPQVSTGQVTQAPAVTDERTIDVTTRPVTPAATTQPSQPARVATEPPEQVVSVETQTPELQNLQNVLNQASFEAMFPSGVSLQGGVVSDATVDPATNTSITQVINPITGQSQVTITDATGAPADSSAVVGTDATGNPITAGVAQGIVSGQTPGTVTVGNTAITSSVNTDTNTSTVVKTDGQTGVKTETVTDNNTGTVTKTVVDPTTSTSTQVVSNPATNTTTVVQSTADSATSVETNSDTGQTTITKTDLTTGLTTQTTTDTNTGVNTQTTTDTNTGITTETKTDTNTGVTTQTQTDTNTGTTTNTQTDTNTGVTTQTQTNTNTGVNTQTQTDTNTGVTTQTTTDTNTGVTTQTTTDTNTNTTTQVTTDTNTGVTTETTTDTNTGVTTQTTTDGNVTTTTKTNPDTGVTTQVIVDDSTGTTTQVTTNPNTGVTTLTTTDGNIEVTTSVDTVNDTQTTIIVDVNTGDVLDIEEDEVTLDIKLDPVKPVPPVRPLDPVSEVTAVDPVKPVTPPQPPKVSTPPKTPEILGASMLPSAIMGAPRGSIDPQFLKSVVTQGYIDPLAEVKQAQAELQGQDLMQQVDPRLAAILQERMGQQQQQEQDSIGALARMLSGEPEASNTPYYAYGQEDSIDDILGGKAAGFAQGGYVAPLQMADGGDMPMALMAKEGGRPREDFRDGRHVAGDGDGQSDDIPAWLADGEFVFPADVVSALGNGSTKAGTDKLYEMMHEIRKRARSTDEEDLPPPALKSPLDYLKSKR